jgi:hypothetical protein
VKVYPAFYPAQKPLPPQPPKPKDISDEDWERILKPMEEARAKTFEELRIARFGRIMPFSKTPQRTMRLPWIATEDSPTLETDLSPHSDEASVMIVGLYPLSGPAIRQVERAYKSPEGSLGHGRVTAIRELTDETFAFGSGPDSYLDLILKFWITAENITKDTSEIFHIEIPGSLNDIICTKLEKGSKGYKEAGKLIEKREGEQ